MSTFLAKYPNLFVKQTKKGCLQELLCGCDANNEFKIATMEDKQHDVFYAIEDTSCCIRFFCSTDRPFKIRVSQGGLPGGEVLAIYDRPFKCPTGNMKCCCYQELETLSPTGESVGKVKEDCWYCVPSYSLYSVAQGQQEPTLKYKIHMPTCCGGVCVNVCKEGCCNCRIPFYIYTPGKQGDNDEIGKIVKVWSGLGTELFTDADKFELLFPTDADPGNKATLLGMLFLLNTMFFERQNNKSVEM